MVGTNPSTPISGTLYKCTSANTWTAYYTPYTYPHPLRLESPQQSCGNNVREGTEVCDGADLAGQDCITQGFTGGTLACNPQCSGFVTTDCTSSQYSLPEQIVEAESGTLSGMQTGLSGSDTYIYTSTANTGSASFSFQIDSPGKYRLEARVNSNNDTGRNSFYVGLDSEPAQGNSYYTYDTAIVSVFAWDNVNRRGTGTAVSEFDPFIWDITQGAHTFWFYGKEANTWLDQIILRRVQYHKSDTSQDGCVSMEELTAFIDLWKVDSSNPTLKDLIEAIGLWKRGC